MKSDPRYKREACVETFDEALLADQRGVDQIELCARLDLDGLTPSVQLIEQCLKELECHTKVIIRPRGGNFIYSNEMMKVVRLEIEMCRQLGVEEVVFGFLDKKGCLDIQLIKELSILAMPLHVTIHKAIDFSIDAENDLMQLMKCQNIKSILTSGGQRTAEQGLLQLLKLKEIAKDKIEVIAAGKITSKNIQELHSKLGLTCYHGKNIVGEL